MQLRAVFLCCAFTALCGLNAGPQSKEVTVHAPRTSATSGKEMYLAYCAACHGKEGRGDGPVAGALKVPPPDLTALSKRNHGKFPSAKVINTINGPRGAVAHGSREMPIWGPIFMTMEHQHESEARLRVNNLTEFIKSLQQK